MDSEKRDLSIPLYFCMVGIVIVLILIGSLFK